MKINSKKLADLHDYFVAGGSTESEDIATFLEAEDESVVEAYVNALKKKHPDMYGGEVAEEPVPELLYHLVDGETGLTKPLEVIKTKKGVCYLQTTEPREIVELIVGGEKIEVDLVKLRKKAPGEKLGNHLVSTLILAAELARG